MKSFFRLWALTLVVAIALAAPAAFAANITLNAGGDAAGTSSFDNNGANAWSNGQDPSAANDYFVTVQWLRTPQDSADYTFQGNSLTLGIGGGLLFKGSGSRIYTANWILDGGLIRSGSSSADTANYAGTMAVTANGGTIQADQGPFIVSAGVSLTGMLYLNNTSTFSTSITGSMSGNGGLAKIGTGTSTVILTGTNTYSGLTIINAGTVQVGSGGTSGSLGSGTVSNFANLAFNRTDVITNGSLIAGTGSLIQRGSGGTLVITNANTYTGATIIGAAANTSVVQVAASGGLGTGTITFDTTGNASGSRLELTGGITLANATINLSGRNTATAAIESLSGNNVLSGTIRNGTGGGTYIIQSDADLLTLGTVGGIAMTNATTSIRTNTLQGAGNGLVAGKIVDGQTGATLTIVKAGAGTWTLGGVNTYTGGTVVNGGRLLVHGSIAGNATVASGGTIGGTGTVAGTVSVQSGGTLSPGSSPGVFTVGSLTLASGATFVAELNGTAAGTGYDQVLVTGGTVALGGSTLSVALGFSPNLGDSFTIISNAPNAAISGTFDSLPEGGTFLVGSSLFQISYLGNGGNDVVLTVVPEPSTIALCGLGLMAVTAALRRQRRGRAVE
jgi:fibronectin-binding autotransporter adhesin